MPQASATLSLTNRVSTPSVTWTVPRPPLPQVLVVFRLSGPSSTKELSLLTEQKVCQTPKPFAVSTLIRWPLSTNPSAINLAPTSLFSHTLRNSTSPDKQLSLSPLLQVSLPQPRALSPSASLATTTMVKSPVLFLMKRAKPNTRPTTT